MKVTIGIADDHQIFVKSPSLLLNSSAGFELIVDALSGKELLEINHNSFQADILLPDANMPVIDGGQTAENITQNYPLIKRWPCI